MTLHDQIKEYGSVRKAALALGIPRSTLRYRLKREDGQEQETEGVIPEGYRAKGTSTLYGADGSVKLQWVKTQIDPERMESLAQEAREAFLSTIPRDTLNHISCQASTDDDLASVYILTDYHLGALSWKEETGADWDLSIAEDMLVDWFKKAISTSPLSATGILAQMGDFLHFDGMLPVTPTSQHVLDADSRFQKVVRVAIRSLRRIINMMLEKHETVHVILASGNHDTASGVWLRESFKVFFEGEERVFVDIRPDPYYMYEHGLTSLFFHHGHKSRMDGIDRVFAAKFREVFGRTKYSYGHMGHLHHKAVKESQLMVIEQHGTLAAPDAYAANGGYLSKRNASVITYSKRFGEIGRISIPVEMIGD